MSENKMINTQNQNPVTIWDLFSRPLSSFADFSPFAGDESNFKVDIKDNGDNYQLTADLPGVKKEDLKLDFEDGVLTISAEHHTEKEQKDDSGYLVQERTSGTYSRSFSFDNIDVEKIDAEFNNGVLSVTLGKTAPVTKGRSITIK